ncbi:SOS response-associated peptidase [candidate division KSB1 bacterium]
MCMRFARESKLSLIEKAFDINKVLTKIEQSYNVAPTHRVVSVVNEGGSNNLVDFKWGLIPSWSKDDKFATKLCNARSETIAEKPSFRDAFRKRRCLVVATGYYEWFTQGKLKTPMLFTMKSREPFGLAGIWESWISPENEKIETCSIITTEANELAKPVHDRMPVIMPGELINDWLHPENQNVSELTELLNPYPSDEMEKYEVSRIVNSPKNNTPECVRPVN